MTVSRSSMLPSRTLTDCSVIRGDQSDGVEAVESVPAEVSDLEGRVNPLFFVAFKPQLTRMENCR